MESEELRELTASERLTLDQEFAMQKSWREDNDKLTFLILDKRKFEESKDEIESLVGDTNIFIYKEEDDEGQSLKVGEAEIMIAAKDDRGKGFGYEAMVQMLRYGIDCVGLQKIMAKIGLKNEKSIRMFEKMGLREESRSEVFQEISLSKLVDNEWKDWLRKQIKFEEGIYKS